MASVWRRGRYWYVSYYDRVGKRITTSSHMTNHNNALRLAEGLESAEILARRVGPDPSAERANNHQHSPIDELIDTWHAGIMARNNTEKHAREQRHMTRKLLQTAKITTLAELQSSAVEQALGTLRGEGLSLSTLNHYVRAVKTFSRWLWRDGRQRSDPLTNLGMFRAQTDRRRIRRPLSLAEIRKLLRAADKGVLFLGMSGRDRGMLYRVMLGTGFRIGEVDSLRDADFQLTATPPVIIVRAAYSKRRREDHQPIRTELARLLAKWLKKRGLPPGSKVFNLPEKPLRILCHDLAVAKIVQQQHRGEVRDHVIDLHSLRHTYITECARHFMPKVTQQLARHSSIQLTMDFYAHLETNAAANLLEGSPFYDQRSAPG